jgi:translation initiation factor IF-2
MKEQPKTVVCASCNAKFGVPDDLVEGKLVKFRCRKCGSTIEVDGRKSARQKVAAEVPPPPLEPTGLDTPATFSQRTLPPPPHPPAPLSLSAANLHPWPEPPRTRSTTAPTSLYESSPPEDSLPPLDTVRDPSNRGPKIAAIVALLVAAGLSGIGLAMRGSPPGAAAEGESVPLEGIARPYVPPGATEPARSRAETWGENANRSNRTPTRVTDLPRAAPGERPATEAKPAAAIVEKQEPGAPAETVNTAPAAPVANAEVSPPVVAAEPPPVANAPAANANTASALGGSPTPESIPTALPPGALQPLAANGTAVPNAAPGAAANGTAVPNAAAPSAPNPASGAVAGPATPAASRAKGDFNTQAAREALEDAADRAAKCKTIDTPSGQARVAVTFGSNGHVTSAVIDSGPIVGTTAGTCVASKFRAAKVPPFSGDPVLVRKTVRF